MKGKVWNITAIEDLKKISSEVLEDSAPVLALYGDLGTGKTTFTQTLARQLGIEESISSPTFVIMKRYLTPHHKWKSLVHIDAYRLENKEELRVLGFEEWVKEKDTLIVIEWADKVEELLPNGTTKLAFNLKGDQRTLERIS